MSILKSEILPERKIFCNRTLNMRSIKAIGYDMDYTLIHYHVVPWEERAYQYIQQQLLAQGWPVGQLKFDPQLVCRGLIIDSETGNLVKANRFGFIKHASHGTRPLSFEKQRETYSRTMIDLADKRWIFLNTLFSLSEGCIYSQLVDLLDRKLIPEVLGYSDLLKRVQLVLEQAHMEGRLKAEIIENPEKFVELDPETPLALLDQYYSGKRLMLITNSEWNYTVPMMNYAFNRFLPQGMTWRDLFELVIVGARKPSFFMNYQPFFEVLPDTGYLKPSSDRLQKGVAYLGGSARQVEKYLGLSGDEILYVGDHMFGDVHVTKNILRWRTALIVRELEEEIKAIKDFHQDEIKLKKLMKGKETLESELCLGRLLLQRKRFKYGSAIEQDEAQLEEMITRLRSQLEIQDENLSPFAKAANELQNFHWGLLMRAGNDKSYLAYQLERYADIYTSRVSNFLAATPFVYLRSPRGSLPHDSSYLA